MKHLSTTALAMALALGGGTLMVQPAQAKKEAAAAGPKLSADVRTPLAAAQTAIKAGDIATAQTSLNAAKAAAKTPDDRYYVSAVMLDLAKANNNNMPMQQEAIEGLIASGKAPADQQPNLYLAAGQIAFQANDFAKAERYLGEAAKLNPNSPNIYPLLAESQNKQGKAAAAVQTIQTAIDGQKAAGAKAPADWYARGVNIAYTGKMPQQATTLTQAWVTDYPNPTNWRDALVIYRDLNKLDADGQLDLMRLQRTAGALKGQADYMEYVLATYLRNPGEAKAVLDEGVKAGAINLAKGGDAAEINTLVTGKIGADKASLGAAATTAKGAKGTGKSALSIGDAYLGYGDYANAAELYKVALAKGGVDANIVNTRLGMALAKAGQKDAARQAFGAVTTAPRNGLAQYWTIWLGQQA